MQIRLRLRLLPALSILVFASLFGLTVNADEPATAERTELAVGDAAPDFSLETFGDKKVVLSERAGENGKPVILLFSRANW